MTKLTFADQAAFNTAARTAGRADTRGDLTTIATFVAGKAQGFDVSEAERAFKLGAVAEYARMNGFARTNADADKWADVCASLSKPPKSGERTDKHRDADQHRAWSAAGMRISRMLRKAGVTEAAPSRPSDAPKPATVPATDNAAVIPAAVTSLAAPKLSSLAALSDVAGDYAASMLRFTNENAKALEGDAGNVWRGMLTDFQNGLAELRAALAKG